ncbi:MAG: FtsX-like permease family protein [Bacteroidetes bacterium]|nr:FtsX-like permease family protein [Bacteroidota bacterium]
MLSNLLKIAIRNVLDRERTSLLTIGLLENSGKIEKTINNWNRYKNSYVYVLLKKGVRSNVLQETLDRLSEERYYNNDTTKLVFIIKPLLKIVPGPLLGAEYGYFLRAPFIIFFVCLGLIIILAASFNYTSMSIALAINRAKEIGIRKTVGANRKQIIIQFIIESIIVAFISLLLAIILLQFLLPLFSMMDIINPKQTIIIYFWFVVFSL